MNYINGFSKMEKRKERLRERERQREREKMNANKDLLYQVNSQ